MGHLGHASSLAPTQPRPRSRALGRRLPDPRCRSRTPYCDRSHLAPRGSFEGVSEEAVLIFQNDVRAEALVHHHGAESDWSVGLARLISARDPVCTFLGARLIRGRRACLLCTILLGGAPLQKCFPELFQFFLWNRETQFGDTSSNDEDGMIRKRTTAYRKPIDVDHRGVALRSRRTRHKAQLSTIEGVARTHQCIGSDLACVLRWKRHMADRFISPGQDESDPTVLFDRRIESIRQTSRRVWSPHVP